MNSLELSDIIKRLLEKEDLKLKDVAAKAKVDRSYLSKLVNSKTALKVGPVVLRKLSSSYPGHFKQNNKNNTDHQLEGLSTNTENVISELIESKMKEIVDYFTDLKNGQNLLLNQGQVIRQEIAGVADYLMLKDAEWDSEKMKELKGIYYTIVRGGKPAILPKNKKKD